jgi:hypothetical protein
MQGECCWSASVFDLTLGSYIFLRISELIDCLAGEDKSAVKSNNLAAHPLEYRVRVYLL